MDVRRSLFICIVLLLVLTVGEVTATDLSLIGVGIDEGSVHSTVLPADDTAKGPEAGSVISLLDLLVQGATHAPDPLADDKAKGPEAGSVGIVDVFSRLNVRSGPSLSHPIIGKLYPGEAVDILEVEGDWAKISWQGREAWVCSFYLWTPGKGVRNEAIRRSISTHHPGVDSPPSRGTAAWEGEAQKGAAGASMPPNLPSGPMVGQREADGGLAVPRMNQNRIGARVPGGFCGPVSLKMALAYYGIDKDINFLGDANVGGATPVYRAGQGAGHQAMLDMLRHCGLRGSRMHHGNNIAWLKQQTDAGKPVVVSVRGNYGPRSTRGHIVVVVGVTSQGDVIINDPAGGGRHVCPARTFFNAWSGSNQMAIVAER